MSWKDNEIDALFKGATPPPPPPFEEGFWEEMEAMLPQKKHRKRFVFWMSGVTALVAGLLAIAFWTGDEKAAGIVAQQKANGHTAGKPEASVAAHADAEQVATESISTDESAPQLSSWFPSTDFSKPLPFVHIEFPAESPSRKELSVLTLPFKQLQRNAQLIAQSDRITLAAESVEDRNKDETPERFYAQLAIGAGQSPLKTGSSEFLHSYAVGSGIIARAGKMELTYGAQLRMDVAANVRYNEVMTDFNRVTACRNLYSFETPLSVGYHLGKGLFALNVAPGFQMGFSGRYTDYDGTMELRKGRTGGKMIEARTLTMEIGLGYRYSFRPGWQLGIAAATDVIEPFYVDFYFGETRRFPVNTQISLRRTF